METEATGRPPRWRRRLALLVSLHAATLVLYLPLRFVARGWLPPVTLVSQLLPWVLGLALPAAALAWWLGKRRLLVVHATALVALGLLVAGGPDARRIETGAAVANGVTLRVASFNLGDDVTPPASAVAWIRGCGADLVCLQEVSESNAAAIERELLDVYPHQVLYGLGCLGSGLLSKRPILADELLTLDSPRSYIVARIDTGEGARAGPPLTVIGFHAPATFSLLGRLSPGGRDLDRLARLALERAPAILVGDFNTTEFSDAYRRIAATGLTDAFRSVDGSLGFTFPLPFRYHGAPLVPLVRIDYLWHTPDLVTTAARVGADGGSDHLPLLVELADGARP